jgi:hypothetical protein
MCILIYLMAVIEHTISVPFHLVCPEVAVYVQLLTILGVKLQLYRG